jgi:hypothetical protein
MNIYRITIVSGNEYTATVAANTPEEARAFAYDLDLDDLHDLDDCAHVVTECEEITKPLPLLIPEEK